MKIYRVGGSVRDELLGLPVKDRDWVVVGAVPADLLARGFKPVGRDFPVFLHPQTGEEYALARTERKTAPGYHGFAIHAAPDVTLEQDLARRDITINSIAIESANTCRNPVFEPQDSAASAPTNPSAVAQPARAAPSNPFPADHACVAPTAPSPAAPPTTATLIDPFGGQRDLRAKVLRHVTDAFREDPVRILRVARFAARFANFSVAPETTALMREMVAAGEASHLVPERVWQELARGLMEPAPQRMFDVLRSCGALAVILPELDRLWGVPQRPEYHPEVDTGAHVMLVLQMAARLAAPLPVRWACLMHDLGKALTPPDVLPRHIGHEPRSTRLAHAVAERLRVPADSRALAEIVAREHGHIHRSGELGAAATVRLLERCDAFRKPERFAHALLACECDARGRAGLQERPYPQRPRLLAALAAAQAVPTAPIAAQAAARGETGPVIGKRIAQARAQAVAGVAQAMGGVGLGEI